MRRTLWIALLPAIAPLVWAACTSDDGGTPGVDAGADATSDALLDAPPTPDASEEDGGGDARDGSAGDADAGRVLPQVPCGLIDVAAADDALLYDVGAVVAFDRRADRLLAMASDKGWILVDTTTGARLATGPAGSPSSILESHGGVFLVHSADGATHQARSMTTGALLHTFTTVPKTQGVALSFDGAYVLVWSDTALEIHAPDGTLQRTILASSLKTPDATPYSLSYIAAGAGRILFVSGSTLDWMESIPVDGSPTTRVALPAPFSEFRRDAAGLVLYDPVAMTSSVTDALGAARGAGVPGRTSAWGDYAWTASAGTVTVWSTAGASAAAVGTYPLVGATNYSDVQATQSGYLLLSSGFLSLRGATPVLSPFSAIPSATGVVYGVAVDPANGDWAVSDDQGQTRFGFGGRYDAFARLGCGKVVGVSGSTTGRLAVTFSDRVELLDVATGAAVMPPVAAPLASAATLSANGAVLVTPEPAAYAVPSGARIGAWTGAPLDVAGDGTRVAVIGATGVEEHATTGGGLLAIHPSTNELPRAIYSPDGNKLAVLADVYETPGIGPVVFTTDVYAKAGPSVTWPKTSSEGYAPTFWITNDLLSGQAIPTGLRNPPRWDTKEGTLYWSGVGAATSTPGAVLYTSVSVWVLGSFVRSGDGYLFDAYVHEVRKADGSMAPLKLPGSVGKATFAGPSYVWSDGAGVRRHRL